MTRGTCCVCGAQEDNIDLRWWFVQFLRDGLVYCATNSLEILQENQMFFMFCSKTCRNIWLDSNVQDKS